MPKGCLSPGKLIHYLAFGIGISWLSFRRARNLFKYSRHLYALTYLVVVICICTVSGLQLHGKISFAEGRGGMLHRSGTVPAVPLKIEPMESPVVLPSATVSIIQSPKEQASQIAFEEVLSMTRRAVEEAGGLEGIVKNHDEVILKPNLVGCNPNLWKT